MKKFLAILIVMALVAMLPLTAFAAGLNEYEKEVLDVLKGSVQLDNGKSYKIPAQYVTKAQNYFLSEDCDMTEAEADAIIGYINAGKAIVKEESKNVSGKTFELKDLPKGAREEILNLGKAACAEVDLNLQYNGQKDTVIITKAGSTTPVFESDAVIKTTGQAVTVDATFVCMAVVICLALATGTMFIVSKKNGLLEK